MLFFFFFLVRFGQKTTWQTAFTARSSSCHVNAAAPSAGHNAHPSCKAPGRRSPALQGVTSGGKGTPQILGEPPETFQHQAHVRGAVPGPQRGLRFSSVLPPGRNAKTQLVLVQRGPKSLAGPCTPRWGGLRCLVAPKNASRRRVFPFPAARLGSATRRSQFWLEPAWKEPRLLDCEPGA